MIGFLKRCFLSYLRFFARGALAKHKPTIIGIAGSVGKSSTAHALFSVLKQYGNTKLVGNSETGIPLGILGLAPSTYSLVDWLKMFLAAPSGIDHLKGTKYLIAEMGIDDPYPPKNMEYLLTILKPDIAIVLNESATHSMQFEKLLARNPLLSGEGAAERSEAGVRYEEERLKLVTQKIAEEDSKIITKSGCKIGIYNADDENINAAIKQSKAKTTLYPFGKENTNAVSYKTYDVTTSGSSFSFSSTMQQSNNVTISLNLPGLLLPREYEQTFAAIIAAAASLGVPKETIIKGLQSFSLPSGRSTLLTGINNSKIIDSSYNASKAAVFAFLELVERLKKQTKRPVVFLFGDMRELGDTAKIEHEEVAKKLTGIVDYLYLVGPLTQKFVLPSYPLAPSTYSLKEIRWFANARFAGEYLKDHIPQNALVLVKGSQNTIFLEEAIKYILANKEDTKKLCRQSAFWKDVKKRQGL
ncbi:MAG: Mur ligase family protein [bacterium]|nr:Mur ligase family protein [bacterium]